MCNHIYSLYLYILLWPSCHITKCTSPSLQFPLFTTCDLDFDSKPSQNLHSSSLWCSFWTWQPGLVFRSSLPPGRTRKLISLTAMFNSDFSHVANNLTPSTLHFSIKLPTVEQVEPSTIAINFSFISSSTLVIPLALPASSIPIFAHNSTLISSACTFYPRHITVYDSKYSPSQLQGKPPPWRCLYNPASFLPWPEKP